MYDFPSFIILQILKINILYKCNLDKVIKLDVITTVSQK